MPVDLRDATEPAISVTKLLSNMTYPGVTILRVLALFLDWIIIIGNSSSASTKICQKRLNHRWLAIVFLVCVLSNF